MYLPPENISTGAAVVICPGGGFERIVIDKEGHDVARWLNTYGIAGIVVKYRTGDKPKDEAVADVQQAIRTARANSDEWKINPQKIGVMGFSAGGYIAAATSAVESTNNNQTNKNSGKPNFTS